MDVSVLYIAINQNTIIVPLNHSTNQRRIGLHWPIMVYLLNMFMPQRHYNSIILNSNFILIDFYNRAARLGKMCAKPCATMGVYFGFPIIGNNTRDPELAYVKLYFKTQINVRRSFLDYTSLSLFGEVGGYIGLLLGFSFLDLTFFTQKIMLYISEKCYK